jgi:transcriptional regulator GlxA family with amidase domain
VQIAEDYALSHTSERLFVTDLCEAAAVSERSLQYAFKELMGMTPVAYLTRLRLHRVRQALRARTNGSTTVTKEALRWGFWHFGDFSEPTRTASVNCRRTPCDGRLMRRNSSDVVFNSRESGDGI